MESLQDPLNEENSSSNPSNFDNTRIVNELKRWLLAFELANY